MKTENIYVYQGDTHLINVVVTDEAGAPVDLSGVDVRFVMSACDAPLPSVFKEGSAVWLRFEAADTARYEFQQAEYEIKITAGAEVATVARGLVRVNRAAAVLQVSGQASGAVRHGLISVKLSPGVVVFGGAVDENWPDVIDFYLKNGTAVES